LTDVSRQPNGPIFKDIECLTLGFDVMIGKTVSHETSITSYLATQHDIREERKCISFIGGGSLTFDHDRDSARCNLLRSLFKPVTLSPPPPPHTHTFSFSDLNSVFAVLIHTSLHHI
jgi:hypothetical protein